MRVFYAFMALVLLAGCGMAKYPGQPGAVSHSYVKVDLEYLEADGLYVYESVYDNRTGADGVGAIVTKLYANAKTYTSNVRTNADGTLYRVKGAYDGADVQMISVPKLNQIYVSPQSHVQFLIEQPSSLDEVDDVNLAEQSLFKPPTFSLMLTETAMRFRTFKWELLRAATLTRGGSLAYDITAIDLAGQKYTPAAPIHVETSFTLNALRTNLDTALKGDAAKFLEAAFPKGYAGPVKMQLKGTATPLQLTLGLHSLKTAETAGYKIIHTGSAKEAADIAARFAGNQ